MKKKIAIAGLLVVIAAGVGSFVWLRSRSAPDAARLLPDSDALLYVDFRPIRLAATFKSLPKVEHDADYDAFVQATGFEFERDLDQAAISVHLPPRGAGAPANNGSANFPRETRFSEIFIGKFDLRRVTNYFRKIAKSTESYNGKEIFVIPVEGRTVRLALVNANTAAVSNVEDVSVIHGMLDRTHALTLQDQAPPLVRAHYKDVPLGSLAWGMAKSTGSLPLPNGMEIPLPADTTWVGSLRYQGNIELEAQAFTPTDADAQHISETLGTLLALFHSIQLNVGTQGPDPDVKQFFDSLQVKQDKNRAIITAVIPVGFFKKIASQSPNTFSSPPQQQAPLITPAPPKSKAKSR